MWAKLDDGYWRHPKIVGLTDGAYRLHVQAIVWACDQLTDGHIPAHVLPLLLPGVTARTATSRAGTLVTAGLWHPDGDGWTIHDFLEYQPTRAGVQSRRDAKQAAGIKGNHVRWHADTPDPDCPYCVAPPSQHRSHLRPGSDGIGNPPDPTRPDPTRSQSQSGLEVEVGGGSGEGDDNQQTPDEPPPPRGVAPARWAAALQLTERYDAEPDAPPIRNRAAYATWLIGNRPELVNQQLHKTQEPAPKVADLLGRLADRMEA